VRHHLYTDHLGAIVCAMLCDWHINKINLHIIVRVKIIIISNLANTILLLCNNNFLLCLAINFCCRSSLRDIIFRQCCALSSCFALSVAFSLTSHFVFVAFLRRAFASYIVINVRHCRHMSSCCVPLLPFASLLSHIVLGCCTTSSFYVVLK